MKIAKVRDVKIKGLWVSPGVERKLNRTKGHEHFRSSEAAKWYQNPKKERKSHEKTTCYNNKLLCTAAVPDPLTAQEEPAEPGAQIANT